VICVLELMTYELAGVVPKIMVLTFEKKLPVIMTLVPPPVEPELGATLLTVGGTSGFVKSIFGSSCSTIAASFLKTDRRRRAIREARDVVPVWNGEINPTPDANPDANRVNPPRLEAAPADEKRRPFR
jgi:hypothetical protein